MTNRKGYNQATLGREHSMGNCSRFRSGLLLRFFTLLIFFVFSGISPVFQAHEAVASVGDKTSSSTDASALPALRSSKTTAVWRPAPANHSGLPDRLKQNCNIQIGDLGPLPAESTGPVNSIPAKTSPVDKTNVLKAKVSETPGRYDGALKHDAPMAAGDLLDSFNSPSQQSLGMDYDPGRNGVWITSEENTAGPVTNIYLVSTEPPYTILHTLDLVGIAVTGDGNSTGVCVLPNGNLLLADYEGDLSVIDDYLFEVNPDTGTLVNYWPLDGSTFGANNNTSTDGTRIDQVVDVAVDPKGNVFVTSFGDNYVYQLTLVPGMPGTWSTTAAYQLSTVTNACGLDRIDCPSFTGFLVADQATTTVAFMDDAFAVTSSFATDHDGSTHNDGVAALPAKGDPMAVWVVDASTDMVGIFDSDIYCSEASAAHTWVLETPLPQGFMDSAVVEYHGDTYVVAGYGSNGEAYKYSPRTDQWTRLADQPFPAIEYPVDGSLGYVFGAPKIFIFPDTTSAQTDLMIYDIFSDSWSTLPLSGGFSARWAADLAYDPVNNLIYISGGATSPGGGNLNELWSYAPDTNTFTQLSSFTSARDFHASCVYNGKLYIAGGTNVSDTPMNSTQVYTISTNTWNAENADLGTLPHGWWAMGDALQSDRLWIMGGVYESSIITAETGYFDLSSGTWVAGPDIVTPVYRADGDLQGGTPCLVGGSSIGLSPQVFNQHYLGPEKQVLVYADDPNHPASNTHVDQALKRIGLGYTAHYNGDFTGFNNSLKGRSWDLVIMANDDYYMPISTWDLLQTYAAKNGRLIFHSWGVSYYPSHALLTTLGATFVSDDTDLPDPIYWWQDKHPFFNKPNQIQDFTLLEDVFYGVYGQRVEPLTGFSPLAGFTTPGPNPNETALIIGNANKTVFKGFMDGQNDADQDSDSIPDATELWENMIYKILPGLTNVPMTSIYLLLLQ
ncbi:MAG: hypothetical protein D3926_01630 [Desulfobacteraceae bacterium]|nr:MAG: hypothetical protein D3926_01630 [Desulfobacteraceae bacterium]